MADLGRHLNTTYTTVVVFSLTLSAPAAQLLTRLAVLSSISLTFSSKKKKKKKKNVFLAK